MTEATTTLTRAVTCHHWAVEHIGFDLSIPGSQMSDQSAYRPEEYQRATRACLESRGYSMRY